MTPLKMPHTTRTLGRPVGWNDAREGATCVALPVTDVDGALLSYWRVSWRERIQVLLGRPVRLTVLSRLHPPVMVDTEP
jgi:hypothetical protein